MSPVRLAWTTELGGEEIARITIERAEFPWLYGRLSESPNFDRFRLYFSDEDSWPDDAAFEDLCSEIHAKGRFVLRDLQTGREYRSFRLNHDGDVVWFRCGE